MNSETFDKLLKMAKSNKVSFRTDMSFAQLTTVGTGGKVRVAFFPNDMRKLVRTLRALNKLRVPFVVLGRGSNVLASDKFFDGAAVVTTRLNKFTLRKNRVTAQCGASAAAIAKALADKGLSGGEFLACLPATAGGATAGNAGCFGEDVSRVFVKAKALCDGKIRTVKREACRFAKRDSVFKRKNWTVLSVTMEFEPSSPSAVRKTIAEMRQKKARTQPLNAKSAGCVLFHENASVSRLIDEAGFKGYRVGGAQVSPKHAGFVLNIDKATSSDIYLIIRRLQKALQTNFGICAKTEVRLVNFGDDDIFTESKN